MQNKREAITKLYNSILSDKTTFNMLQEALTAHSRLDEKFITEYILPLARKFDSEITWEDILNYEKAALSEPTKLSLAELKDISGGKTNFLLNCGLLALMGFAGGAAANTASADFIPFTQTKEYQDYEAFVAKGDTATEEEIDKYENTTLGDVPFYKQADHLVDGLLWFYNEANNTAFYIMDRRLEGSNSVYTYSPTSTSISGFDSIKPKPSLDEIKAKEYTLINVDELDDYLKASFNDANTIKFDEKIHGGAQTLQLINDNPLFGFSRFYNPNFGFDKDAGIKYHEQYNGFIPEQDREKLSSVNMYAHREMPGFQTISWHDDIKNDDNKLRYAEELASELRKLDWSIAHRMVKKNDNKPEFNAIESMRTLIQENIKSDGFNNGFLDKDLLRYDNHTFFTLQVDKTTFSSTFQNENELYEVVFPFEKIPFLSCSRYMLSNFLLEERAKEMPLAFLDPVEACFNGTAEEVKNMIIIYYINFWYEYIKDKNEFNINNLEKHLNEIICLIQIDELEVRIPSHINVKREDWHEVTVPKTSIESSDDDSFPAFCDDDEDVIDFLDNSFDEY